MVPDPSSLIPGPAVTLQQVSMVKVETFKRE